MNCEMTNEELHQNIENEQYQYSNITFTDDIIFKGTNFKQRLSFNNCTFNRTITFEKCSFNHEVNFEGSIFKNKVCFIKNSNLKYLNFLNCKIKYKLYITNSKDITINFTKAEIYDLKILNITNGQLDFTEAIINGYLFIDKEEDDKLNFQKIIFKETHFTNNSKITLTNLVINEIFLEDYANHSTNFRLKSIKVQKYIEILDIHFNNEKFIDVDLRKVEKVKLQEVTLSEGIFENIKWGVIEKNRFCASEKNFRQLKFFAENQRNFKESDAFYALEMRKRKEEFWRRQENFRFPQKVINYFNNIFILEINETVSNYTQNWILPILWIFIMGMMAVMLKKIPNLGINCDSFLSFITILASIFVLHIFSKDKNWNISFPLFFIILCFYLFSGIPENYLDDLVEHINPFRIFKPILDLNNEAHHMGFIEFIYKLIILFLGYQVLMSLKKKVRNK